MGDLAKIEALFFALIGGSPGAEVVFLNQNLGYDWPRSSETSTRTSWVRSRIVSSTSQRMREIVCGRSNSITMCSVVSGRMSKLAAGAINGRCNRPATEH